jgi:hypothetical protein
MQMRAPGENAWRVSPEDRGMEQVPRDKRRELGGPHPARPGGIDGDGDGQINEDGPGSTTSTATGPPTAARVIQYGSSDSLCHPEPANIARFCWRIPTWRP